MAHTIDERPTVIGNKIIITGTYTAGSAFEHIELNGLLSNIDFCTVQMTGLGDRQSFLIPDGEAGIIDGAGGGNHDNDDLVQLYIQDVSIKDTTVSPTYFSITSQMKTATTVGGLWMVIGTR
jgi:hypothetical protein